MPNKKRKESLHASWKGLLRIDLIAFPVLAYNARSPEESAPHFRLLHKTCDSPIQYRKFCPLHGEVANDEIVQGYEYEPDKFVHVEEEERKTFLADGKQALTIDSFTDAEAIDPLLFDGRHYFLAPAGPESQHPYGVIHHAMNDKKRLGIGRIVLADREQLAAVRPVENLLAMSLLNSPAEMRKAAQFEVPVHLHVDKEVKMAEQLIEMATRDSDLDSYEDLYKKKLERFIEAKVEGKETETIEEIETLPLISLTDALKRSLAHQKTLPPRPDRSPKRTDHRPTAGKRSKRAS